MNWKILRAAVALAAFFAPASAQAQAPPAEPKAGRTHAFGFLKLAVPALLLIIAAVVLIPAWQKKEHARNVLLPAIEDRAATMVRSNRQIFDMAVEAENYLPNDPTLARLWSAIATTLSIETEPAGAEVFWKDYNTPVASWRLAGVTPFKNVKVPHDFLRLEIRKPGYQTVELAAPSICASPATRACCWIL